MREPFCEWRAHSLEKDIDVIESIESIVVKVVVSTFDSHPRFKNPNDFFALFDKVIGLTRDSAYQTVSSFLIAEHFNSWNKSSRNIPISVEEYENIMRDNFDRYYKETEIHKNNIKSFDIIQFTYEELYVDGTGWERLEDYLGVTLDRTTVFTENTGL